MTTLSLDSPQKDLKPLSSVWLHVTVGLFVIVCSFIYGLVHGLSKNASEAVAARSPQDMYPSVGVSGPVDWPLDYPLPSGIRVVPMGNRIAVNGKSADIVSFFTSKSVASVVDDQMDLWHERGLKSIAAKGPTRATAISFDTLTQRKLTMTAWEVPKHLRAKISGGQPVQGVVAIHHGTLEDMAEPEETAGEIPGVPVMDGSDKGAVFSSLDRGGRSYTAVYTNPGTLRDNVLYYAEAMTALGWELKTPIQMSPKIRTETFHRGGQEASLLFAPTDVGSSDDEAQTLVTVIVAPLSNSYRGGPR